MKIVVFPKDSNPYQELLYRPMRQQGHHVRYLSGLTASRTINILLLPFSLVGRRLCGYKIFHVHWTFGFVLPWGGTVGRMFSQLYFRWVLAWAALLGYKIIWTAHNVMPHTQHFYDDLVARQFLAKKARAVIVHSAAVLAQMKRAELPTAHTSIIPHGSYVGVYPAKADRRAGREFLALPEDAFVYVFVGTLKAYKGLESLVAAFEQLLKNEHKRDLRLVIAGSPSDERVQQYLLSAAQRLGDKLIVHNYFITDEKLQYYFAAADVAVLPFAEISTSGSALLALSFGVPLVAPRMGGLQDLPENVGYWYDPVNDKGLFGALKKAPTTRGRARKAAAASAYARSLSWKKIASRTLRLFGSA